MSPLKRPAKDSVGARIRVQQYPVVCPDCKWTRGAVLAVDDKINMVTRYGTEPPSPSKWTRMNCVVKSRSYFDIEILITQRVLFYV